jgi:nitroreductase
MHTFDAIRTRRSVKHYDATHRFTDEEEHLIVDLAKEAPSSINAQHWRLVSVKDPEIRRAIRAVAMDQTQVTDASLLFVICADFKAWEKSPERYVRNAPQDIQELYLRFGHEFYTGKEQLQRDEALRSASFIAHTMMLTAKAMGYDSCPMIGYDSEAVAKIIRLPENHIIAMMLAIGKGTKEPWPKAGFIERSEFLIRDRF